MPLQQLVEYFNDRLELENNDSFRPFTLQNGNVQGLFGPVAVGSVLSPLRQTLRTAQTVGHIAQLSVAARHVEPLQSGELESLLAFSPGQGSGADSIINFDRLARTVHMLNFLPHALDGLLFLDVDPRHILGVKHDHGAYFEEIILKCGLQTRNVVIGLAINTAYSRFYPALLKGLQNYQRRGYQLALKLDVQALEKAASELITRAAPDFVCLSAEQFDQVCDSQLLGKIQQINQLTTSTGGRNVLLNIHDKKNATLARQLAFDVVEGRFYEQPVTSIGSEPATRRRHASRFASIAM